MEVVVKLCPRITHHTGLTVLMVYVKRKDSPIDLMVKKPNVDRWSDIGMCWWGKLSVEEWTEGK